MFELSKIILQKVSFDHELFRKELGKAIKWLQPTNEVKKLYTWCTEKFDTTFKNDIEQVFQRI